MRQTLPLLSALALLAAGGPGPAQEAEATDDEAALIASAESAAPATIAKDATIHGFDANGQMTTLREGTNGWWCMPDDPNTPTPDPMCGDANTMDWLTAYINKTEPAPGKTGFSYMLAGAATASNTDPYATAPAEGADWVRDGPHVMIMNPPPEMLALYPSGEAMPDTSKPYVMYGGTPYAHLMIPVE